MIRRGRHIVSLARWRRGHGNLIYIHEVHASRFLGHCLPRLVRITIDVICVSIRITGDHKTIVGGYRRAKAGQRKTGRPHKCRHNCNL
jgi:hypothetical protein